MWQADRTATLKKSIYAHQNLYKYEGKETWWSPKVGELPETHKMFPGNVYRERLSKPNRLDCLSMNFATRPQWAVKSVSASVRKWCRQSVTFPV